MARELFDEAFRKRLSYLQLVSKKAWKGRARGERRARRVGSGIEFADHRDYQHGDDLRYIDWNVYGRLDRLLVRLFDEEEDLHIHFLVDASESMQSAGQGLEQSSAKRADPEIPSKFDQARRVVAALSYIGLGNLDRVSVHPFGGSPRESLLPGTGKGQVLAVLEFLRALTPAGKTDLGRAVSGLVHGARRRGLVVVVSDFFDPGGYEKPLELLRHHRFEPMVIQVVDAVPSSAAWLGDVELYDCETGEAREVTLSPKLLSAYRREHDAFCQGLHAFCGARGIPSLAAPVETPFDELVLQVMREGGFLA